MKVTKKMYEAFNAKCENGFKLDVLKCLAYGEKVPKLTIDIDNETILEVRYEFSITGSSILRTYSLWKPTSTKGCFVMTHSGGAVVKPYNKTKRYSRDLCECTKSMNQDEMMKLCLVELHDARHILIHDTFQETEV